MVSVGGRNGVPTNRLCSVGIAFKDNRQLPSRSMEMLQVRGMSMHHVRAQRLRVIVELFGGIPCGRGWLSCLYFLAIELQH